MSGRVIAAYGVLNASKALRASWGVDDEHLAAVRAALVQGGASNAVSLVPDHVLDDILVPDPDPKALGAAAQSIGATDMAVPAFSIDSVPDRVAWARPSSRGLTRSWCFSLPAMQYHQENQRTGSDRHRNT